MNGNHAADGRSCRIVLVGDVLQDPSAGVDDGLLARPSLISPKLGSRYHERETAPTWGDVGRLASIDGAVDDIGQAVVARDRSHGPSGEGCPGGGQAGQEVAASIAASRWRR